ncbi:hypothetical protein CJO78_03315 [Ralstonia solanacearum]|uniref:Uncharacterized protein n=3 Tax=Ralstonia solanacearum species complex TaxID=3116862 RepID=A0AAD0S5N4_RALSL|nr:hypothetical protein B0B51_13565 [blood disease bacterium A2-HR MARDI]AXV76031.1 hypothetical protein CJO76_03020 [Ralstonia solanacearum]CBJ50078.1 conserved hypothethical protein [Ralstonia solanacearum PSI07]CCA81526.1 conserved hypothetical protein [blood disease bacterium R229]BEU71032.1 hypothetical protein MAFF211271_05870 [Ralstonia pseudosolanacearum]
MKHATPTGLFEFGAISTKIPLKGRAYYPQKKTRALQGSAVCKATLQAALHATQRLAQDQVSTGAAMMPRSSQLMKARRMQSVRSTAAACVCPAEAYNLLRESAARVAGLHPEFISVRLRSGGAPMNRSLGWSGDAGASWDRAGRVAQSR